MDTDAGMAIEWQFGNAETLQPLYLYLKHLLILAISTCCGGSVRGRVTISHSKRVLSHCMRSID
jgi:hypothetical protein